MKKPSPAVLKIIITLSGLVLVISKQLLAGNFDIATILATVDFGDVLEAIGFVGIGGVLIKRVEDTTPKQVEAKVEAKVAAKVASIVPPPIQPSAVDGASE